MCPFQNTSHVHQAFFCGLQCVRQTLEDYAYLEFPDRGLWGPLPQKNNCFLENLLGHNWDYCCDQAGLYENQARVLLFRVCSLLG